MITIDFYNKAVDFIPVSPSRDKEFRFHFYNTLDSYEKLVSDNKINLSVNDVQIEKLKGVIRFQT